jgi:hypothetical protein
LLVFVNESLKRKNICGHVKELGSNNGTTFVSKFAVIILEELLI